MIIDEKKKLLVQHRLQQATESLEEGLTGIAEITRRATPQLKR